MGPTTRGGRKKVAREERECSIQRTGANASPQGEEPCVQEQAAYPRRKIREGKQKTPRPFSKNETVSWQREREKKKEGVALTQMCTKDEAPREDRMGFKTLQLGVIKRVGK